MVKKASKFIKMYFDRNLHDFGQKLGFGQKLKF
ncbi:hypothetical protein EAb13_CDS0125 [Acinetobacter phage EAb13]|nr:hypothetical protein EAb13_CDS0007 [Acinetobacter phage EAb13]WGH24543.1 hypothetical protein EAb13_CDS0125 [Acinetobacter phage EAb13]